MIYADIADFWMMRAQHAERASASGAQQAASDKDVKLRILEFIDVADAFLADEMRRRAVLRRASESIVNTIQAWPSALPFSVTHDPFVESCCAGSRRSIGTQRRQEPTNRRTA